MRGVILLLLFLLPFVLSAAIRTGTGQWRANGRAKELYPTPVGHLYQLAPNEGDGIYAGSSPAHEDYNSCRCAICSNGRIRVTSVLSLKMPNKLKITAKTRYITLDFRIRLYPALEKKGNAYLCFALLDSQSPIIGARHFDLHGLKIIEEDSQNDFYFSWQAPSTQSGRARNFFHPAFEPLSVRVVYDLMGKEMTYYMNGRKFEKPAKIHGKAARLHLRHFGLATYERIPFTGSSRKHYFEVSEPVVYLHDDEGELPRPPRFAAYPYNQYRLDNLTKKGRGKSKSDQLSEQEEFRKVQRHKNPDLIYAYALRYLYGAKDDADPEKGVQLLKQAAKKHHTLALYQLGICFWRGYGCLPDSKDAVKYLNQAIELGYPEAAAARLQLEMEKYGRPWFLSERYVKQSRFFPHAWGHDGHYFLHLPEFFSPKRLWGVFKVSKMTRPGNPEVNYLDHRLRANDPFSFLAKALALFHEKPDRHFNQGERYLERALKSRHFEAYPFWLLRQLYRNQLPEEEKVTLEMRLLHADNPIFNLAYGLLRLPEAERMKYLRKSGKELRIKPLDEWQTKTPESHYLLAMMQCMGYAYIPWQCLMPSMAFSDRDHAKRRALFELILKSAKAKCAPAQYLIGKFYFYDDLPLPYLNRTPGEFRLSTAESYLSGAAEHGYAPAAWLLCKLRLSLKIPPYGKILPVVEWFCERKVPEAFYLKARVLLKLNRRPEALAAAEKAVEMGEQRGLLFLIEHDTRKNASELKRERQVQYIQADRAKRRLDPHDPFWNEPYGEYLKWESPQTLKIENRKIEKPTDPQVTTRISIPVRKNTGTATRSAPSTVVKKNRSKTRTKIRYRSE